MRSDPSRPHPFTFDGRCGELRRYNRRQLLRQSASALLAAGCWPGALAAGDPKESEFRFAVVNDLHYLNANCGPWFGRVVASLRAHQPAIDFLLVAGDLVEHGTSQQHGAIRDLLQTLKAPYHVVIGNHDYPSPIDRQTYEQLHPGRINYHFEHRGWQFIGLDTTEGTKSQAVAAPQSTLDWLDAALPKLERKKPTVVFTHFPLGFGVPFLLRNADAILERLKPYNLRAAFCGHYHGFTEKKAGAAALTTNKCCSFSRANHDKTPQKGYFLCDAKAGALQRSFVEVK